MVPRTGRAHNKVVDRPWCNAGVRYNSIGLMIADSQPHFTATTYTSTAYTRLVCCYVASSDASNITLGYWSPRSTLQFAEYFAKEFSQWLMAVIRDGYKSTVYFEVLFILKNFSHDVSAWTLFEIAVLCFTPIASYSIVKCSCSPRTLWHFNHTRL